MMRGNALIETFNPDIISKSKLTCHTQSVQTGTSMSAPLAAGVGATLLGESNKCLPKFSFALCQQMIYLSMKGVLRNIAGDPAFPQDSLSPKRIGYNKI
jgi:hypothetical protein